MRLELVFGFIVAFFILLILVGNYMISSAHEQAHAKNCKYYGGNVTYSYASFPSGGATLCNQTEEMYANYDSYIKYHGERVSNDVTIEMANYPMQSMYFSFAFLLSVVFIAILPILFYLTRLADTLYKPPIA
jgi:hypothetical protein